MNMNPTRDQLFDVIELMMNRLDSLEIEQKKQKEFSVQMKKKVLELNNFINDIMDVIEKEDKELLKNKWGRCETYYVPSYLILNHLP